MSDNLKLNHFHEKSEDYYASFIRAMRPDSDECSLFFPDEDCSFQDMKTVMISDNDEHFYFSKTRINSDAFNRKLDTLAFSFSGESELLALNAFVIANLRRNNYPNVALVLFRRLWATERDYMLKNLPIRWIISALTTFSVFGENVAQRRAGSVACCFAYVIKLYETERQYSGVACDFPFPADTVMPSNKCICMGLPIFWIKGGPLLSNLIVSMYKWADQDPITGPLLRHILNYLNFDQYSIFSRISIVRGQKDVPVKGRRPPEINVISNKNMWDHFNHMVSVYESSRNRIAGDYDSGIPPISMDLASAKSVIVQASKDFKFRYNGQKCIDVNHRLDGLAQECDGRSELELLVKYLSVHAKKRVFPDRAKKVFLKAWEQESDFLISKLSPDEILQSIEAFSSFANNDEQAIASDMFYTTFSLVRAYETERLLSGVEPTKSYDYPPKRHHKTIPFGELQYWISGGDLHSNIIARLYMSSMKDDVISKPCVHILNLFISDGRSIYNRLKLMRKVALSV